MAARNDTAVTEFILLGLTDHPQTKRLLFALCLAAYMLTLCGNLTILVLIQEDSRLHTPMYFFVSHLSLIDICYTTSSLPQMLTNLLSDHGTISFAGCVGQLYVNVSMGVAECFLLAVMAYDRYVAVCHPLHYAATMEPGLCSRLAGTCWVSGFLNAVVLTTVTFFLPYCGPNQINHFFCEAPAVLQLACADTESTEAVIYAAGVIILMIPFALILASYLRILASVLHTRSATSRRRAFSTCGSHLAVVSLYYGTISFMYMRPRSSHSPEHDKKVSVLYAVVTPMLNPMIYSLRNKEVKGAMLKVLGKTSTEGGRIWVLRKGFRTDAGQDGKLNHIYKKLQLNRAA
ncbi:PREDICTED: olfactory receptor-like protein OLF3 [Gekko japonicus]|uniref:Olfactory receptor n=1 Tax=Gekko japonicus TaxID=146911 RepID=A0ABM1KG89_GEKJA|nr:PREDICTED: olfactory receptor-like protein OLF3 [Gekko japonicus]